MSGEPADFDDRDMARWISQRRPTRRQPPGPRPTLAQMHKSHPWLWVWCDRCHHHAPMAVTPLIIRWGPDASSDKLRQCARCTACGGQGRDDSGSGMGGFANWLCTLPDATEHVMTCKLCDDTGWVCEDHGDRPVKADSERSDACDCPAAMPCPACNADDPPRPPRGMTVTIGSDGPRH